MMKKLTLFFCLFLASQLYSQITFTATPFTPTFATNPVGIVQAPGDDRFYIVLRNGLIRIANPDGTMVPGNWLDISARVYDNNSEQGLLGLAFDPDYQTTGEFYVHYIIDTVGTASDQDQRISRFKRSTINPLVADPNSEVKLICLDDPYWNHNGGGLVFGPDGYLYCGMGDGGSAGDPGNRAQNTGVIFGKLLRINVTGGLAGYTSPVSNPFYGQAGHRNELWTYGNRNPWRFNFDRITGDLWIGDVGQDAYEEIDHAERVLSNGGENYGWRCYEGTHPYNTTGCGPISNYTFPKAEIPQATGPMCSVTMGEVYRGAMMGDIYNKMIFSDYCYDYIWTLDYDTTGAGTYDTTRCNGLPVIDFNIVAFAQDRIGNMFFCTLHDNSIYKLGITTCTPAAVIESPNGVNVTCDGNPITLNSAPGTGLTYQWLFNGTPIGGATDSTYTTSNAGNYQLIVTNSTCGVNPTDTSSVFVLGTGSTLPASIIAVTVDTACLSVVNLSLNGSPAGGDYLSPYVNSSGTFYPQVAGLGTFDVVYRYQSAPGQCIGYDTMQVKVVDCSAGIENSEFFGTVKLYPNPADEFTILSFESNTETQINLGVMSIEGRLVQQIQLQAQTGVNNVNINTSALSSGIYMIQMTDGINHLTRKIVIE